ncbi:MAG: hypothetical protein VB118_07505 [Oscillospiraceae bacterium]|nr:hypothetical protein [Oscillospiraceae bacterium]
MNTSENKIFINYINVSPDSWAERAVCSAAISAHEGLRLSATAVLLCDRSEVCRETVVFDCSSSVCVAVFNLSDKKRTIVPQHADDSGVRGNIGIYEKAPKYSIRLTVYSPTGETAAYTEKSIYLPEKLYCDFPLKSDKSVNISEISEDDRLSVLLFSPSRFATDAGRIKSHSLRPLGMDTDIDFISVSGKQLKIDIPYVLDGFFAVYAGIVNDGSYTGKKQKISHIKSGKPVHVMFIPDKNSRECITEVAVCSEHFDSEQVGRIISPMPISYIRIRPLSYEEQLAAYAENDTEHRIICCSRGSEDKKLVCINQPPILQNGNYAVRKSDGSSTGVPSLYYADTRDRIIYEVARHAKSFGIKTVLVDFSAFPVMLGYETASVLLKKFDVDIAGKEALTPEEADALEKLKFQIVNSFMRKLRDSVGKKRLAVRFDASRTGEMGFDIPYWIRNSFADIIIPDVPPELAEEALSAYGAYIKGTRVRLFGYADCDKLGNDPDQLTGYFDTLYLSGCEGVFVSGSGASSLPGFLSNKTEVTKRARLWIRPHRTICDLVPLKQENKESK